MIKEKLFWGLSVCTMAAVVLVLVRPFHQLVPVQQRTGEEPGSPTPALQAAHDDHSQSLLDGIPLSNSEARLGGASEGMREAGAKAPDSDDIFSAGLYNLPTSAEVLAQAEASFDSYALGEERFIEDWADFVSGLDLSELDKRRVKDMIVSHDAHNLELAHLLGNERIGGDGYNENTISYQELEERFKQVLSSEQLDLARANHEQNMEKRKLEREAMYEEWIANEYTDILVATGSNDLPTVLAYIASGADVNAMPVDGTTSPLHNAARHGNVEIIQALLNAGSDVNAITPEFKDSPLQRAASSGSIEAIRALVAAGADLEYSAPEFQGATALKSAAMGGHTDAVAELLRLGADATGASGVQALMSALQFGDPEMEQMLINAGADPNAPVVSAIRELYGNN